jgi:predicted TIM-barrel fold metal-dependent hydrolase
MTGDDLRLAEYRPRSALRVPVHQVARPRHRAIDVHNHLGAAFGGEWATRQPTELLDVLDAAGVELIVDLDGGQGDDLSGEIDRWQRRWPDRIAVFAGLDYDAWALDRDFGEIEARRLRDSAARGARGLKVWKTLGLLARDPEGRLVAVDDARLDPIWSTAGELGLPVLIHVADPIAFFEPLDLTNERWEELHANPAWHFWPPRPAGDPDAPGFPGFDELLAGLDRLIGRHPTTTFIGAHVASAAEDLALVGRLLDRHPNLSVDIAARLGELGRQPYSTRSFFLRYSDRILFGVDMAPDPALYAIHYRFLETYDESFDYSTDPVPGQGRWQIHGIGLPDDVLRKVYRDNASRVLRFSSAAGNTTAGNATAGIGAGGAGTLAG